MAGHLGMMTGNRKGIKTLDIRNLCDRKLRTFVQLKAAYGIENKDDLKYMQIILQWTKYLEEAVV